MKKLLATCLACFLLFGVGVSTSEAATKTYTVKTGDNLYRISLAYNTTVANLKKWNQLKSDVIHPNQKLVVGNVTTSAAKPNQKPTPTAPSVKKEMVVEATAYTAYCNGCTGITKTGINLRKNPNQKVIAVDPKVIPLGAKVYVEGYGTAIAGDIGGAIKGNRIDVFMPSKQNAFKWGRKKVKIQVLN